jgi:hypothetical protein
VDLAGTALAEQLVHLLPAAEQNTVERTAAGVRRYDAGENGYGDVAETSSPESARTPRENLCLW